MFKWIYVESGTKNKKVTFKLCSENKEYNSYTDHNVASMEGFSMKKKGFEFENSINEFLDDCRRVFEDEWNGKKSEFLVNRMTTSEYKKFLDGK